MKKCKGCQKEIDQGATKCPYCQTDQRNWFSRHKVLTGLLAIIVLIIIGGILTPHPSQPSVPATDDAAAATNNTGAKQPTPTQAVPQTLLKLSGSGTNTTEKFTASGDWDLNWSYDCSSFGQSGNFVVSVFNADGSMSLENAPVNQLGKSGSDVEHYHTGGQYYLEVDSECKWSISVKG